MYGNRGFNHIERYAIKSNIDASLTLNVVSLDSSSHFLYLPHHIKVIPLLSIDYLSLLHYYLLICNGFLVLEVSDHSIRGMFAFFASSTELHIVSITLSSSLSTMMDNPSQSLT